MSDKGLNSYLNRATHQGTIQILPKISHLPTGATTHASRKSNCYLWVCAENGSCCKGKKVEVAQHYKRKMNERVPLASTKGTELLLAHMHQNLLLLITVTEISRNLTAAEHYLIHSS